jgi:hypothetical protein
MIPWFIGATTVGKATYVILIYAMVMLGGGAVAFFSAPPEANRATALLIPGAIAGVVTIFALLAAMGGANKSLGKVGVYGAVVVMLLAAAAIAMPAYRRMIDLQNYPAARAAFDQEVTAGKSFDGEARKQFYRDRKSPDHDTTYLVRVLWALAAVSLVSGVALLANRPKDGASR